MVFRRFAMGAAFVLACLSLCQGTVHAQEQEGVIKPPKMLQFHEAEYPKDKHAAGITSKVLLSIEIGDGGHRPPRHHRRRMAL